MYGDNDYCYGRALNTNKVELSFGLLSRNSHNLSKQTNIFFVFFMQSLPATLPNQLIDIFSPQSRNN